jgi:lysine-specific demethylase 8/hypoxia-inducible factor 1-alpha inhibitor (HIF hydroxylase)
METHNLNTELVTRSRTILESTFAIEVKSIQHRDICSLTPGTFFAQYQKPGIPVVITSLLQENDWNLEYLCENLGNQDFLLRCYGQKRYKYDKRQWKNIGSGIETQRMAFTEYANLLRNHVAHEKDIYLAKCSLKNTAFYSRDSLKNIGEQLGLKKPVGDLNLWVGPGGHVESLHYDAVDGTLMQLHGAKKIVLFPPSQLYNLYPFPIFIHLRHGLKLRSSFSQVYPENPDFQAFPKLKKALRHKYEVILNQGEVLFIPAGWWHEVTALGDEMVCSVNRFWGVYPTSRIVFSRIRWRIYIGYLLALPDVVLKLAIALFSRDKKQKLSKILQML